MENLDNILAKYFSGEANASEKEQVEVWKSKNPIAFNELEEAWQAVDERVLESFKTKPNFDDRKAWNKVNSQLIDHTQTKVIKLNFYKKVAAACALFLVGIAAFFYLSGSGSYIEMHNTASTPEKLSLPDGSEIWLAPNTELAYHKNFEENRDIQLNGEAFFEVAKDADHPFTVKTDHGTVSVLGTAFNVNTTDKKTEVSVDHGKVALTKNGKSIELTKGEAAEIDEAGVSKKHEVSLNYDAWKTGNFTFDNTPLSTAIEILNKHYEKTVVWKTETAFKNEPLLTGRFENEPLDSIIKVIVLTCDVEAEYGDNEIILR